MSATEEWLFQSLSQLLDFPVPNDLTQYILQISNDRDLDDYLKTLLDIDNRKHRNFVQELKQRRASDNLRVGYKKVNDNENPGAQKPIDKKKNKSSKEKERIVPQQEVVKVDKTVKKKTKFSNFYSQDKQTVLLKNRTRCDCEAKVHSLINNCLNCGRIVCAQEGSGPCFFCSSLVCTPDQQTILSQNTKQSDSLYNKLIEQKPSQAQAAALEQRDILLDFDRNSTKRTQVIDDECDYYQTSDSVWLSDAERKKIEKHEEEVRNIKHGSRLTKKVTVDLYGRQIEEEELPQFQETPKEPLGTIDLSSMDLTNPMSEFDRPQYVETIMARNIPSNRTKKPGAICRIQDKELRNMHDEGWCLSLHQPWASLLVAGIKKHEGRNWYSAHRGRLWIHAASKVPSAEEISTLEHQYKFINNENINFPSAYPTGCLLGCVTVVDVLQQTEYRRQYPNGESESPYVFICEDFYELKIKFPMQGRHKIYKLDKKIHQAAQKCVEIL